MTDPGSWVAETAVGSAPCGRHLAAFVPARPRLRRAAARLLGSDVDADDVVQEAWLRWSHVDLAGVQNADAYLVTVTTRLALDRLRRSRREICTGADVPESTTAPDEPADAVEADDEVRAGLRLLLESLTPLERTAFLLHDVFDHDHADVAALLGRSGPAVRQLVHRARRRVAAPRRRFTAGPAAHHDLVERFRVACRGADAATLLVLLDPATATSADAEAALSLTA